MAYRLPSFLLQHTVTIEPYQGNGANGPVYGAPVTVKCFRDDKRRLVRGSNGSQVVSESTVYCLPGTVAPPESRINLGTRVATVITSADRDGGHLPVPSHVEVNCT
jgi:hypothetical protein